MTATTTTRLGLYKTSSDGSDLVNVVTDLLSNLDAIDLAMGSRIVTSSTRPSSPYGGQHILESDNAYRSYVHNGTSPASGGWVEIPNNSATYSGQIWTSRATDASTIKVVNTFGGGNTNLAIATEHAAAAGLSYGARVTGDTFARLAIRADGRIDLGSGSGARDTSFYRSTVSTLKTDGSFVVGATLAVTGAATIAGATALGSTLSVAGNTTLSGDLTVSGVGQLLVARKTANQSISNSTAQTDDTHLQLAVVANGVYIVDGMLIYGADPAVDLKLGFTGPAGAAFDWAITGQDGTQTGTSSPVIIDVQALGSFAFILGGSTNNSKKMSGKLNGLLTIGGTAGTFKYTWAQQSSSATATIMYANSYIRLHRVA